MKISSLQTWLAFVDVVVAPAEKILREAGYADDPAQMLILAHLDAGPGSAATHSEHMAAVGDHDRTRAARHVILLRDHIRHHAARVAENPDQGAALLAALAWKLHMYASGLNYDFIEPAFLSARQSRLGRWERPPSLWLRGFCGVLKAEPDITPTKLVDRIAADGHWTFDDDDVKLVLENNAVVVVDLITNERYKPISKDQLSVYLSRARNP